MAKITCPKCNQSYDVDDSKIGLFFVCSECQSPINTGGMSISKNYGDSCCSKCNNPLRPGALFCTHCGTPVKSNRQSTKRLLKIIIATVFVLLIGTCAVVTPKYLDNVRRKKREKAEEQIKTISKALYRYHKDVTYTSSDGKVYGVFPTCLWGLIENVDQQDQWKGPYLDRNDLTLDPWGSEYQYIVPGEHGDFDLYSFGGDGCDGGEGEFADICSWKIQ